MKLNVKLRAGHAGRAEMELDIATRLAGLKWLGRPLLPCRLALAFDDIVIIIIKLLLRS